VFIAPLNVRKKGKKSGVCLKPYIKARVWSKPHKKGGVAMFVEGEWLGKLLENGAFRNRGREREGGQLPYLGLSSRRKGEKPPPDPGRIRHKDEAVDPC